jgi:hypothetical protein
MVVIQAEHHSIGAEKSKGSFRSDFKTTENGGVGIFESSKPSSPQYDPEFSESYWGEGVQGGEKSPLIMLRTTAKKLG